MKFLYYILFAITLLRGIKAEEETHAYQAEISRLLDIIINSLYTHPDIFLREVISNASDALDKVRYLALQNPSVLDDEKNLQIKIIPDEQNQTLTIWDTGIGMNREDLINNLGTIARSGTTQFLEAMKNKDTLNQIGQFGVGFYSIFLVAAHITVISQKPGQDQWIWSSDASNGFKISKDNSAEKLSRGTKVIIKLKDDMREYLKKDKIKKLIKRYSNYIGFPIYMEEEKKVDEEVPLTDSELAEEEEKFRKQQEENERKRLENPEEEIEEKEMKKTKTVQVSKVEWVAQNSEKAIWMKSPSSVEESEYNEFYKTLSNDYSEPLDKIHFKVEGEIEFTALLYIPKVMPYSYMMRGLDKKNKASLKLFVRRVLISDDFKDLLPSYFHFIKGVVDSDDLPLNVSRETLQQQKTLKIIKKKLIKKIIDKLTSISKGQVEENLEDEEKMTDEELEELDKRVEQKKKELIELYDQFWKQNGGNIKQGIIEDKDNRKLLAKISKWKTTKDKGEKFYSFEEYIERKKPNQTQIYYFAGDDLKAMLENPILKGLSQKGYEVILCPEPFDEVVLKELDKYEEIQLTNIGQSNFEIPQDESEVKMEKRISALYEPLTKWAKELLKEEVENVSMKFYSEEDALVVVASDKGYSAHMQNLLKYQSQLSAEERKQQLAGSKKNVILNPYHPFVKELLDRVNAGADKDTEDQLKILYNASLLRAGFEIQDQASFQTMFQNILKDQLGIPRNLNKVELDLGEEQEQPKEEKTEETKESSIEQEDSTENQISQEEVPLEVEELQ